jgi:hypothetical protein
MKNERLNMDVKKPNNFDDIRKLMHEYERNKEYIDLGRDGSNCLLGFIWENGGQLRKYEPLNHIYGDMFANMLEDRNKLIEKYLSEGLNNS